MNDPTVLILLATYNGEEYICQMLDSLLVQDYPNVRIVVSDDGSSDGTADILDRYAAAHPALITHYHSGMRFGNAKKHFTHLLSAFHDAPYIMFCDQDDIWHPDKISKTLRCMQQVETSCEIPALVHTDLRVVGKDLELISPSFCAHSGLDGNRLALNQLLVQNVVTGCTCMINGALAKLAAQMPYQERMMMHDWWLALIASACGNTGFLNEPTIDYRQHGNNSVGAKNVHSISYLMNRLRSKPMRKSLQSAADQADAFFSSYHDVLTDDQIQLLKAFIATRDQGLVRRDITFVKFGLLKSGTIRKLAQLLGL